MQLADKENVHVIPGKLGKESKPSIANFESELTKARGQEAVSIWKVVAFA